MAKYDGSFKRWELSSYLYFFSIGLPLFSIAVAFLFFSGNDYLCGIPFLVFFVLLLQVANTNKLFSDRKTRYKYWEKENERTWDEMIFEGESRKRFNEMYDE